MNSKKYSLRQLRPPHMPVVLLTAAACAILVLVGSVLSPGAAVAQGTAFGEIEDRPAPVSRRQCVGGVNVGDLCNENADCPGSSCRDRNLFNISVSVRFDATAGQLTTIRNAFSDGSELLFDVTDGQAQFGQVMLFNNSTGARGHFWVTITPGNCSASTGTWGSFSGANITTPFSRLSSASADGCVAHEFVHLAFDARDEYESRPGCGGTTTGGFDCPDASQGPNSAAEENCLMDGLGSELCWGQAVGDSLAAGNHDATNVTEQSQCRSNRSCWDQIGWSWPETMLVPAGAPHPGSNGLAHQAVVFLEPPATSRLVLVLDRSGSMSAETPSRLERLQTAALDVVSLAENGVELGLVSYSSTATDEVAIAALGANRSAYNTAINNLNAGGATNIGDGLQHAYDMIIAAGGVTGNTGIILMTDGINNRPSGTAAADLAAKLALLNGANIPVYVTCTGGDLGTDSQCAEIAAGAGAGGSYIDSEDAGALPARFVSLYELLVGGHAATSEVGAFGRTNRRHSVDVEAGATEATFVAQWKSDRVRARMLVEDPDGSIAIGRAMDLGAFHRASSPKPGVWQVWLEPLGGQVGEATLTDASPILTARARERFDWRQFLEVNVRRPEKIDRSYLIQTFLENPIITVSAAARHKVIQPGEAFEICAYPVESGPITGISIFGEVETPSGRRSPITLLDDGGLGSQSGDEIAGDGAFCTRFVDTRERGGYVFRIRTDARVPRQIEEDHPGDPNVEIPLKPFKRWTEFSATVDDTVRDPGGVTGIGRCGVQISPFLGLFNLDRKLPIEDGLVAGVRVAACRSPRWDIEGELGVTFTEDVRGDSGTVLQASVNALYHLAPPGATVRPFVTAGVGGLFFRSFSVNDDALAVNLGLGAKARLAGRYGLRLDLRDYIADDAFGAGTTHNYQATLGLTVSLP